MNELPLFDPASFFQLGSVGSLGTFFWFMYWWIAELVGVPSELKISSNLVILHELSRLLDCLRRTVAVIVRNERDLAPVDPALVVDHCKEVGFGLPEHTIRRCGAAVRCDVADLDLAVAGARVVFLLRLRLRYRKGDNRCRG